MFPKCGTTCEPGEVFILLRQLLKEDKHKMGGYSVFEHDTTQWISVSVHLNPTCSHHRDQV